MDYRGNDSTVRLLDEIRELRREVARLNHRVAQLETERRAIQVPYPPMDRDLMVRRNLDFDGDEYVDHRTDGRRDSFTNSIR
jgi:hypothetical protein